MQFRKTPLALAAIALCGGTLPLVAQTTSTTIEAESMTLSVYTVENGTRIRVPSGTSTGTATRTFSGASGTYNIQVYVIPEDDGRPTLEVHRGSTRLTTYTYPLQTSATSFTVNNVALNSGDVIKLVGKGDGGAYARVDKIVLTQVSAATSSTPYTGTPIALPKAFEAVNFDKGGQGLAYRDLTAGNDGGQYRTGEDVDIVASSDSVGGPYAVRNFQAGEWMNYTVNVPSSGNYDLAVRVANTLSTLPSFHIEVDGANVSGPLTVPNTGSLTKFQWVGKAGVPLAAGKRVVKIVADQQQFSLNSISMLTSTAPLAGDAMGSVSPTTIEAESMSLSTYTVENGTRIRLPSGTATGTATKAFSGASGKYDLQVYVIPENDGRPTLEVHKGSTRLTTYTYPLQTTATSFKVSGVTLASGEAIKLVGRGDGGAYARVDKIVLTPSTSSSAPAPSEPVGTPSAPEPVGSACANPSSGYEGFGRNTTGGAGKTIYRVTNLNNSGSGSLRDALSQGNRCVVFDVGGTISLSSNLYVRGANVTIDGLTAPSPGISLKNATLVLAGSSGAGNVVLRGIRHRGAPSGSDGIRLYGATNVVIDRVSVSGFGDGAIDVTENSRDVTIQWSILGQGAPSHNFVSLLGLSAYRITAHHNLYINGDDRHPKIAGPNGATSPWSQFVGDVRNNLVWNFRLSGTQVRHGGVANVINNYYWSPGSSADRTIWVADGGAAYTSGNFSKNGWNVNTTGNRSSPYSAAPVSTTDAVTAAQQVLTHAGARGARFGLDSTDEGYIGQVKLDD